MKIVKFSANNYWLVIPLILAVLARIIYLLSDSANPISFFPIIDEREFLSLAQSITQNGLFSPGHFWHPPFYTYFLSILLFAGASVKAIVWFQMLLGVAGVLLLFQALKQINFKAALISSSIWAVYPIQLFIETRLVSENLFIFLLILLFYVFCYYRHKNYGIVIMGILTGLLVITRSQFVIFLFAYPFLMYFIQNQKMKRILIYLGISIIFPLAVSLHNMSKTEEKLFFISSNGPVNLYIGNSENIDKTLNIRPIDWKEQFFPSLYDEAGIYFNPDDSNETFPYLLSNYLFRKTIKESSGLQTLFNNFFLKTLIALHAHETPRNYDIYQWRQFNVYLKNSVSGGFFYFPSALILFAGLIFLFISFKKSIKDEVFIFSSVIIIISIITSILFFNAFRYRLTIIPWLIFFAVLFYTNNYKNIRLMAVNLLLIIILGTSLTKSILIQKIPASETYRLAGDAFVSKEKFERAEKYYEKSLREAKKENAPDYVITTIYKKQINLALMTGNQAKAENLLELSAQENPNDATIYFNKANNDYARGNYQEGIQYFNMALSLKDVNITPMAYHGRALCFIRLGNIGLAMNDFDSAILLKPDYAEAWSNRGILKGQQGNSVEAIKDLSRAIDLNPDYGKAYTNRGIGYLSIGNPKLALPDFEKAIQLDSLNQEAWYLKAMSLIESGAKDEGCKSLNKAARLGFKKAEEDLKLYCK